MTPQNSEVVQFNLGQTGGTSGSPVFDHEGFIVAVGYAGVGANVVDSEGVPILIPIGDLDFGIRVDEVWTPDRPYRGRHEAVRDRFEGLPVPDPYPAYPDAWNGRTPSS